MEEVKMEKKEEIDQLIGTAINKLKEVQSKDYSDSTLDDLSWIFSVYVKNFYDINYEFTREELVKALKEKSIDNAEKNLIILFAGELEYIKYLTKEPDKKKIEKLITSILKFLELKLEEVGRNA